MVTRMNTRTSANVRLKQKKQPSRLICAMQESPVAFGVSAGLIVLGFAAGTAVSQGLSGGALAASFFSELEVNVWAGFARSALYNASLAAMMLLMRVNMVFVPVSFLTFAIKGAALGFAFDAVRASPGGLFMSFFAVLMPSLPAFTALSLLLAGAMKRGEKEVFLRDSALFFLGILSEGLLSQAIALFIDAAA